MRWKGFRSSRNDAIVLIDNKVEHHHFLTYGITDLKIITTDYKDFTDYNDNQKNYVIVSLTRAECESNLYFTRS